MNSKKPYVGIVADDLTSAADGGAPFWDNGLQVAVLRKDQSLPTSDVVSIDCSSRSLSESAAVKAITRATNAVVGAQVLFKTVDSTLRGHIRAEIGAAFQASGRNRLVVAPAFPDAGRTTKNGVQYVNGKSVCHSDYAKDPVHPILSSQISDCIPSDVRNVVILDAETQQELNEQVGALGEIETTLWVGSPGLATALAKQTPAKSSVNSQLPTADSVLVVVGSANPISRAQVSQLHSEPRAACLVAPNARSSDPKKVLADLLKYAPTNSDRFDAIIATGGDTMEALLERLDVQQFFLAGEIEPGFPLAQANLADEKSIILAMKAGGFGDKNTLRRAVQYLCSSNETQREIQNDV